MSGSLYQTNAKDFASAGVGEGAGRHQVIQIGGPSVFLGIVSWFGKFILVRTDSRSFRNVHSLPQELSRSLKNALYDDERERDFSALSNTSRRGNRRRGEQKD